MIRVPCTVVNEALPLANDTVDASCTQITFVNATADGNMTVTINLTAALQANPESPTIMVSIVNMSLSAGAVLLIDARSSQSPGINLSVAVLGLRGPDGALAIGGAFPCRSSILVQHANMTASIATTAPKLALLDPNFPSVGKILMLFNLTVTNGSLVAITDSSLRVTASISCLLLYICLSPSAAASSSSRRT